MTDETGKGQRGSTPEALAAIRDRMRPALEERRTSGQPAGDVKREVLVCAGGSCISCKSLSIGETFRSLIAASGLEERAGVVQVGCMGLCDAGPFVLVSPDGVYYDRVDEEKAKRIVAEHLGNGEPVADLELTHLQHDGTVLRSREVPYFARQLKIALRNCGVIDPLEIDEYIALDGYLAYEKVLREWSAMDVLKEINRSGLRGRGGGGFPAGLKWQFVREAPGDEKYVVCNADEGDPGAFMDRSILEGDPHSVIEAMAIAGRLVGARRGYVYVRAEYPLAIERLGVALEAARERGLLGEGIFGTDFSFDLEIRIGAGAFVCGEETALMRSIEGARGMPRTRPPFPARKGLYGKPTLLNNVETWANIPPILLKGADWYAGIGTAKSKGTKVFALAGDIRNTGLVEVPMGISLREVVHEIGGGTPSGRPMKAAQSGGPSGGCVPATEANVPVDYESLQELGAIMGSGGLIVMDDRTCMVELARFFLEFVVDESCGKCPPCRIGNRIMLNVLEKITRGEGTLDDLDLLERLGAHIRTSSLCGLGQTAPNPVLSTLRHFREEYVAHVEKKRCPATVCKEIISAPCQHTCPISTEASTYVGLIAAGKFDEAWEVIRKDNPLASVCGRVCHHPCETRCQAGSWDGEPISIRALKRFAADRAWAKGIYDDPVKPVAGKGKVAIVGSGPAGLAAAHTLALRGYAATIFEALPIEGGAMAVAIPDYRLPPDVLQRDIDRIKKVGVEIRTGVRVGTDIQFTELREQFDAVFIALGAQRPMPLNLPGEDVGGVMQSLTFLRQVNLGEAVAVGPSVGLIGGGNSAIDAARAARRLPGVDKVTVFYRRTRNEMPAFEEEVEAALEEGIEINFLTAPKRILADDGKVTGVEFISMDLGEPDDSGRRRPVPREGSEYVVELDSLITAIGERPDPALVESDLGCELERWGGLKSDPETFVTNIEGVFAGGDVVTGPNTVIDAIAAGKWAGAMIDRFVSGEPVARSYALKRPSVYADAIEPVEDEPGSNRRAAEPHLDAGDRAGDFREVVSCLGEGDAMAEAKRCLRCDLQTADARRWMDEVEKSKPA